MLRKHKQLRHSHSRSVRVIHLLQLFKFKLGSTIMGSEYKIHPTSSPDTFCPWTESVGVCSSESLITGALCFTSSGRRMKPSHKAGCVKFIKPKPMTCALPHCRASTGPGVLCPRPSEVRLQQRSAVLQTNTRPAQFRWMSLSRCYSSRWTHDLWRLLMFVAVWSSGEEGDGGPIYSPVSPDQNLPSEDDYDDIGA